MHVPRLRGYPYDLDAPRYDRRRLRASSTAALALLVAAVVVLLLVGCGDDGEPERAGESVSDGSGGVEDDDRPVWLQLADDLGDDGEVSPELALRAVAAVYGPIEGVDAPSPEAELGSVSGSEALRWASQHWDTWTDEQHQAIADAVGADADDLDDDDEVGAAPHRSFGTVQLASVGAPTDIDLSANCGYFQFPADTSEAIAFWRDVVDGELATLAAEWGPPTFTVQLSFGGANRRILADASPIGGCGAPATGCHIRIHPALVDAEPSEIAPTLAHELVHCYQYATIPLGRFANVPSWQVEGLAEWATIHFHGTESPGSAAFWTQYLESPTTRLFARSYDAAGFFLSVDALGGDPWRAWSRAAQLTNRQAYEAYVEPVRVEFEDGWASSYARDPGRGEAWDQPHALAPPTSPAFPQRALVAGDEVRVEASPMTSRLELVDLTGAEVVDVLVQGAARGRLGWATGDETVLAATGADLRLCALPEGCLCPDGTTFEAYTGGSVLVAVSGIMQPSSATLIGRTLDEACNGELPSGVEGTIDGADALDPCVVGTWRSSAFTLPGPDAASTQVGGAGAVMTIAADGAARWDFAPMEPMVGHDPQLDATTILASRGAATATVEAMGGTWVVEGADTSGVLGSLEIQGPIAVTREIAGGPGLYAGLLAGSYDCRGGELVVTATDPALGVPVVVTFGR